jgi:imidazolonepropionase-like amidohydrolase
MPRHPGTLALSIAFAASLTVALQSSRQPLSGVRATRAFTGATLIDGTGGPAIRNAVLLVRNQRVVAAGAADQVKIPDGAQRIDVSGRTIVPGFINSHGHVGSADGLKTGAAVNTAANVRRQLLLYARYGITSVVSLGDDGEAGFRARATNPSALIDRARLYVAGPVITASTPDDARKAVDAAAAARKPNWIKIRVDDNLGASTKMAPDAYRAVIDQAHARGLRVAAHVFYLADAKDLVRAGVDLLAHSVRDRDVDRELIDLMKARGVCLCPTLTREISTFVYESRPAFFDDPFFERYADPAVVAELEHPDRQKKVASSAAAQAYKKALEVARRNVKALHEAGVGLAFGTDTGPPGRFQGYFEHLELEELVKSGLTPAGALLTATGNAATCMGLADRLGTLQEGRYADFIVLARNPLDDVRQTRSIESVWISGNQVKR